VRLDCPICDALVFPTEDGYCPECGNYIGDADLDSRLADGFDLLNAAEQDDTGGGECDLNE